MAHADPRDPTSDLRTVMAQPLDRPRSVRIRIGMILLTGACGFLAGIVGGIVVTTIVVPAISFTPSVVRSRTGASSVKPMLPPLAPIAASVVDVFTVEGASATPVILPLDARTGRGIALTSDGWVVTVRAALPSLVDGARPTDRRRPVIVGRNRRILDVDRIAFDPITDLAFLHAPGLEASVLPLRPRSALDVGTSLVLATPDGGIALTTLRALHAHLDPTRVREGDHWASVIAFAPVTPVPVGSALLDTAGALIGIVTGDGAALSVDAVTTASASLFGRGAVLRNTIGLTYRDASEFGHASSGRTDGAVLTRADRAPAVTSGSVLDGRLAEGDVITAVGEDTLTSRRLLPELLQEYPIGATVTLHVLRGTRAFTTDAALAPRTGEVLLVAATPEPASSDRRAPARGQPQRSRRR